MRGRAADRFGRFVSPLSTIGITLGVMALVTVLSVMNGFERELQNNIPADAAGRSLPLRAPLTRNSCRKAR